MATDTLQMKLTMPKRQRLYAQGAKARTSGLPLFANPHIGEPARIWSYGWRGDPLPSRLPRQRARLWNPRRPLTDAPLI